MWLLYNGGLKMEDIQWIFSGIGTAIITFILGFFIGRNKTTKQAQKAGNDSNQVQIGEINNGR
jgi:hypothetical protein